MLNAVPALDFWKEWSQNPGLAYFGQEYFLKVILNFLVFQQETEEYEVLHKQPSWKNSLLGPDLEQYCH